MTSTNFWQFMTPIPLSQYQIRLGICLPFVTFWFNPIPLTADVICAWPPAHKSCSTVTNVVSKMRPTMQLARVFLLLLLLLATAWGPGLGKIPKIKLNGLDMIVMYIFNTASGRRGRNFTTRAMRSHGEGKALKGEYINRKCSQ